MNAKYHLRYSGPGKGPRFKEGSLKVPRPVAHQSVPEEHCPARPSPQGTDHSVLGAQGPDRSMTADRREVTRGAKGSHTAHV